MGTVVFLGFLAFAGIWLLQGGLALRSAIFDRYMLEHERKIAALVGLIALAALVWMIARMIR